MTIRVIAENRPAASRYAVVLCCDAKYLPYAALTIHTLLRSNPGRDYDICITSLDALEMPHALEGQNIRLCQIDVGDAFDAMPVSERLSVATYMRLAVPAAFEANYDRILYLDCDVFVVGAALSDVFTLDLGGRAIGACLDTTKWKYPNRPTKDQVAVGISGSYFNAGVLLIDCKVYEAQGIRQRCVVAAQDHAESLLELDQTLLNFALQDAWAMLHPAWNWQWVVVRPFFETYINVQIVHFIGSAKPWSDQTNIVPVVYRETARRFLGQYYPDIAINIPTVPEKLNKWQVTKQLLRHLTKVHRFIARYNHQGGDITKVLPPDRG